MTDGDPQPNSVFEKHRDLLVQEIAGAIDSVIYNLDTLNRTLDASIQVGSEFNEVGKLWNNFYDGLALLRDQEAQKTPPAEELDTQEGSSNEA